MFNSNQFILEKEFYEKIYDLVIEYSQKGVPGHSICGIIEKCKYSVITGKHNND